MRLHGHRSRLRALTLSGALLACLAVPAVASADTTGLTIQPAASRGATITVSPTVRMTSKVMATFDVRFTCDPLLVYDWETGETHPSTDGRFAYGTAVLIQAQGRSIASASSEAYGGDDVLCDGTTIHTRQLSVLASTLPWKGGSAIAGVSVSISDTESNVSDWASSGPVQVKLVK